MQNNQKKYEQKQQKLNQIITELKEFLINKGRIMQEYKEDNLQPKVNIKQ